VDKLLISWFQQKQHAATIGVEFRVELAEREV